MARRPLLVDAALVHVPVVRPRQSGLQDPLLVEGGPMPVEVKEGAPMKRLEDWQDPHKRPMTNAEARLIKACLAFDAAPADVRSPEFVKVEKRLWIGIDAVKRERGLK